MCPRIGSRFGFSGGSLALGGAGLLLFLAAAGVLTYYHIRFGRMIEGRLGGQGLQNISCVYAAPRRVFVGQTLSPRELVGYLQQAGYTDSPVPGAKGRFLATSAFAEIRPSSTSYFGLNNALWVEFAGGEISRIRSLGSGEELTAAELEPQLLTSLFATDSREKRRLVRFDDLPPALVTALLSAEDRRFFEHPGVDPLRALAAAWINLRRGVKAQGASTITMQAARSFFFSTKRTWRRKLEETLMALELERRFTKQQILELYANQIYLGNRGSFAILGFGEAAHAYFSKEVRDLTLGEAAFLAGIIRSPNRYSSSGLTPERAAKARDRVLALMVESRAISPEAAKAARKAPLALVENAPEGTAAPYFTDMVKQHLLERFSESELLSEGYRIYTTLDPALERAAVEAIEIGMNHVDAVLAHRYERWRERDEPVPEAQVALVALDPHTGEIKALVGGRDYGHSQLNRVLARRQPGSVFKPFVYAAALNNAVEGLSPIVTPVTTVVDEPTEFFFADKRYSPNNYHGVFHGTVTLREALTQSMNVASVKLAELVGYGRVVQVARQLGLGPQIQPTPLAAMGVYEMTPLDVAAGYTVFANGGTRVEPMLIRSLVSAEGKVLERGMPRVRQVLDPRVAYLVTNILEDVVSRGTAAGIRARGFTAPAAGKTGTSEDGWFAGFTPGLLCVVWVGFDDNRNLGVIGAASAVPIWAEFMKRAVSVPQYQSSDAFSPPEGVKVVTIDPETLQLATPSCPAKHQETFVTGTEPTQFCVQHRGRIMVQVPVASWLSRVFDRYELPPPGTLEDAEVSRENQAPATPANLEDGTKEKSSASPYP